LGKQTQKQVGIKKQREYTLDVGKLTFRRAIMSKQAKVLTAQEIRRVLDYVATRPHAVRNRAMFLTMLYAIYVLRSVPHSVTLMCWTQRARLKLSFTCPQSKPKGVRAVRCLSVSSSAKSYKLTFVLSHPNHLHTNYSIHKNVQRRAGTATHSVSSSITCFATAIFQAAVATAHAAQALPIWQTKIVPLPTPPR
jgi:hypothetical protein